MHEVCTDNRFELIEKYKKRIIKRTNIETCKEEMEVLDNIFFRLWQMGWLDILEIVERENHKKEIIEIDCRKCKNLGDDECKLYGKDPNVAVKKCAHAGFKNYVEVKEND